MESLRHDSVILDARAIVRAIASSRASAADGVLAFDGDGTLWSGDVGEDVFHYATGRGLLREDAREALADEAARYGIDASGSASAIATRIFEAYAAKQYPEREVCAMMTWCYAGFELAELEELIDRAFEERNLPSRLTRELEPVFTFARAEGIRTIVVSASPQPIVERAARLWDIAPSDIAACHPAFDGERVAPRLATEVPYAEAKLSALATLSSARPLLASFGDNAFDVELLAAARLGVAVRPKPALRARLAEIPGVAVLATGDALPSPPPAR